MSPPKHVDLLVLAAAAVVFVLAVTGVHGSPPPPGQHGQRRGPQHRHPRDLVRIIRSTHKGNSSRCFRTKPRGRLGERASHILGDLAGDLPAH